MGKPGNEAASPPILYMPKYLRHYFLSHVPIGETRIMKHCRARLARDSVACVNAIVLAGYSLAYSEKAYNKYVLRTNTPIDSFTMYIHVC